MAVPFGKAKSGSAYKNNGSVIMQAGNTDARVVSADYLGVRADLSSKVTVVGPVGKAVSANALPPQGGTTYEIRNVSATVICPGSKVPKLHDYGWAKTDRTTRILNPVSSSASGGWYYSTGRPIVNPPEYSLDTLSSETLPTRDAPGNSQMMTGGKLSSTTAYPAKNT